MAEGPCPWLHRLLAWGVVPAFLLTPLAALAGSATAESIWDQHHARLDALQQVPAGAVVTRTACQEIAMAGDGNFRYRCTVWWEDPPAIQP